MLSIPLYTRLVCPATIHLHILSQQFPFAFCKSFCKFFCKSFCHALLIQFSLALQPFFILSLFGLISGSSFHMIQSPYSPHIAIFFTSLSNLPLTRSNPFTPPYSLSSLVIFLTSILLLPCPFFCSWLFCSPFCIRLSFTRLSFAIRLYFLKNFSVLLKSIFPILTISFFMVLSLLFSFKYFCYHTSIHKPLTYQPTCDKRWTLCEP